MPRKRTKAQVKRSCDKLWSELIRRDGACEYCGTTENLNAHHLISRAKLPTRWMKANGICLCVKHHTFCKDFSAHGNPLAFGIWFVDQYGEERRDFLIEESRKNEVYNLQKLLEVEKELKELIK